MIVFANHHEKLISLRILARPGALRDYLRLGGQSVQKHPTEH
jgi:hypothetical protein